MNIHFVDLFKTTGRVSHLTSPNKLAAFVPNDWKLKNQQNMNALLIDAAIFDIFHLESRGSRAEEIILHALAWNMNNICIDNQIQVKVIELIVF